MLGAGFMMSHAVAGMMGMWDPSKRFGEIVAVIENPMKMLHDQIFVLAPFLDGEMLDVNVPITGSRAFQNDHMESCHIINEQSGTDLTLNQPWLAPSESGEGPCRLVPS